MPVWFVLHDAETVRANLSSLTSHYQHAANHLKDLIDEVRGLAPVGGTVGDCSPHVQSLLLQMIRIIDGDLSITDTAPVSPFAQVRESTALYGKNMDWAAPVRESLPPTVVDPAPVSRMAANRRKRRNPPWTQEEILLATEVYVQNDGRILGPHDQPVIELSDLLNRLPIIPFSMRSEKFRNPEGVGLKLSNIRAADPTRPGGSPHGNRLDGYFWDVLNGDQEVLFGIVKEIKIKYGLDVKD